MFRNEGRSAAWKLFKERISRIIIDLKRGHADNLRKKLDQGCKSFHRCVSAVLRGCEIESWDVRTLRPDQSDLDTPEELVAFFNSISEEYAPLNESELPSTFMSPLPVLTEEDVLKKSKKSKKTTSTVPGDLPHQVVRAYPEKLSATVTHIYNAITEQKVWPES